MAARSPRDTLKSTWRSDKSQWNINHWLLHGLAINPTDLDKEVPVHQKTDKMPYVRHIDCHIWILVHATWPLVVQQLYNHFTGKQFHILFAFVFYSLVFTGNAIHELHMMRKMGHEYGFLDGDKHARDQVPDHSVGKTVRSLIATATFRPVMALMLAWNRSQTPLEGLSWWLPLEIALYGPVLDFWFYWYHRVMHEFDGLWKFHRTHHLTKHPNPLLTLYADQEQEIFDIAGIPLLTWVTLRLMGFPMSFYDWWYCYQYVVFTELFGHSGLRVYATSPNNVYLRLFGCELAIEDHDMHHRQGWKKSMNYGKQTLLWDTIFGTTGERIETKKENIDYTRAVKLRWGW